MEGEYKTVPCRGCGEPMIWATASATGAKIPMDAEPVTRAVAGPKATLYALVPTYSTEDPDQLKPTGLLAARQPRDAPEGYLSHFVTCEKRSQFTRKGGRR